jgi:hypothetical protein
MDKLMEKFNTDANLIAVMHQAPSHALALDARTGSTLRIACRTEGDDKLIWQPLVEYVGEKP